VDKWVQRGSDDVPVRGETYETEVVDNLLSAARFARQNGVERQAAHLTVYFQM